MADQVFISYSRADEQFAKRLFQALEKSGRAPWIDWESIPASEDWWREILSGIDGANTLVLVITPDSLASPICTLEIAHALANNKRIIPLIRRDTDPAYAIGQIATTPIIGYLEELLDGRDPLNVARDNWKTLSRLNWLYFRDEDDFQASFEKLSNTIDTDIERVRLHTRLLLRARLWDENKRDDSFLLAGTELREAQSWLTVYGEEEPQATDDHRRFIQASLDREAREQAERERQIAELNEATERAQQATLEAQRNAEQAKRAIAEAEESEARAAHKTTEAQQNAERARKSVMVAIVLTVLAVVVGMFSMNMANDARAQASDAYEQANNAQTQAAIQVAALNAILPGATQGARWNIWVSEVDEEVRLQLVTAGAPWTLVMQVFDGVEMVLVPAGCFMMGSEEGSVDEQPVHEVCFADSFWIDRYEVTNAQYGSTGCDSNSAEPNQPHNCISWFDAKTHCENRAARLPTEAEWEYAARGPNNLRYPWGNEWDEGQSINSRNSRRQNAVVESIGVGSSWISAYNMSGNVGEWVNTIYDTERYPYPYTADDGREDNNETDARLRVVRGIGGSENLLRSANRDGFNPSFEHPSIGFRCAHSE